MSQREVLNLLRDLKAVLLGDKRIRNNFQSIADLLSINAFKAKDQAARHGFQSIERRVFALAWMTIICWVCTGNVTKWTLDTI